MLKKRDKALQSTEGKWEHIALTVQPSMRILVLLDSTSRKLQKWLWSVLRCRSIYYRKEEH